MAPMIPRFHLFEINDETWFPAFLRAKVQAGLTIAWTFRVPILQWISPAHLVAQILGGQLGTSVRDYVIIDFCAGAGGPTPFIERELNKQLALSASPSPRSGSAPPHTTTDGKGTTRPTYAEVTAPDTTDAPGVESSSASAREKPDAVRFVLTDLHPHADNWARAAAQSPNIEYEPEPVDAANAPPELVARYKARGKRVFRMFNLAFHHFDDPLARAILKNTVETSDGFGIFELQDRSFGSFLTCCLFGLGIMLVAPYYAWLWRSPATLFFTYLVPVLPFVLVFDGWVSSLRTRTPEEVEVLLRTCGAAEACELERWEVRSGSVKHLWPCGYLHWVVCVKK